MRILTVPDGFTLEYTEPKKTEGFNPVKVTVTYNGKPFTEFYVFVITPCKIKEHALRTLLSYLSGYCKRFIEPPQ